MKYTDTDYKRIFSLYSAGPPATYSIRDTSHGEQDYRLSIFAEWPDGKIVIKITDNDFTTPDRVAGWAETISKYQAAGYYCPRILLNRNGNYTESFSIDGRNCLVYAEEYSEYRTADTSGEKPAPQNSTPSYPAFTDEAIRSIGIIGARHLDTASFPSGLCILEKFAPSDPCDEVMEESLHFKEVIGQFLPRHQDRFRNMWNLFLENKRKLEEIYPLLPTSVFQGDLNPTNLLLDHDGSFKGILDFNLCGRDTILNHLFREIIMEYDGWGFDIFYSREADAQTLQLFLKKIQMVAESYPFSRQEIDAAPLVYRYVRPFWWRPAHEIEHVKDDDQKVLQVLDWVERELTRTDIPFARFMTKSPI